MVDLPEEVKIATQEEATKIAARGGDFDDLDEYFDNIHWGKISRGLETWEEEDVLQEDITDWLKEVWKNASEGGDDKKELREKIDVWLKKWLKRGTRLIRFEDLDDIDDWFEDILIRADRYDELSSNWKFFRDEFQGYIDEALKLKLPNTHAMERILEEVSAQIAFTPDDREVKNKEKSLRDMLKEVGHYDKKLTKDRREIYIFWRKVFSKYKPLVSVIKDLKQHARSNDLPEELEDAIEDLSTPPNYVRKFPQFEINLRKKEERITELMLIVFPGSKRPTSITERERSFTRLQRETDFPYSKKLKTPYSSRRPMSPGEMQIRPIGEPPIVESVRESDKEVSTFAQEMDTEKVKVDPILRLAINQGLKSPVAEGEMQAFREMFAMGMSGLDEDSPILQELEDRLKVLAKQAAETGKEFYLPLTSWLEQIDEIENINRDISEVNEKTGNFFDELGELLFENMEKSKKLTSGPTLPLYQTPTEHTPKMPKSGTVGASKLQEFGGAVGGGASGPGIGGKQPKPKEMRQLRAAPYVEMVQREFDTEVLNGLIKKLKEALNDYYFLPLSHGKFVDEERPDFVSGKGGGRYPYKRVRLEFSTSPVDTAKKGIYEGTTDNISKSKLEDLKIYFEQLSVAPTEKNLRDYARMVKRAVVALNALFPKNKEENKIWGGWRITEYLKSQGRIKFPEMDFMGTDIALLRDNYNDLGDKPIQELRQLLQSNAIEMWLRTEEAMTADTESRELIDDLLDLTSPRDNKLASISVGILNTHDVIRKMQGKKVVTETLYLDDIRSMDYIINRMEDRHNVEVNALEINSIVKSVDSFANLSKNFGLSKEIVYEIKGLCR